MQKQHNKHLFDNWHTTISMKRIWKIR